MDHLGWQVEDDRHGRDTGVAGPGEEDPACVGRQVRGVDDAQAARPQAARELAVESPEREARGPLVRRVAGDERRNASDERISSAAKWRAAKVDLPEPAGADQDDEDGSGSSIGRMPR